MTLRTERFQAKRLGGGGGVGTLNGVGLPADLVSADGSVDIVPGAGEIDISVSSSFDPGGDLIAPPAGMAAFSVVALNPAVPGGMVLADSLTQKAAFGIVEAVVGPSASGKVTTLGVVENPAWSWTLGLPLFLEASGAITQTPPASGILQPLGDVLTATRIYFRPRLPILR